MNNVYKIILFPLTMICCFLGCAYNVNTQCRPMLFPYVEYGYQAKPKMLNGLFDSANALNTNERFDLKLSTPEGWSIEEMGSQTLIFRSIHGTTFLFSIEKDKQFESSGMGMNLLGCDYFNYGATAKIRTERELYTDIFLFTEAQLSDNPAFSEYAVLWSKSELLRDAVALYHYQGDNLEAFQRNMDPERSRGSVQCEIVVFPNKIAPDYITIASRFTDDAFFADFLDMVNTLNP